MYFTDDDYYPISPGLEAIRTDNGLTGDPMEVDQLDLPHDISVPALSPDTGSNSGNEAIESTEREESDEENETVNPWELENLPNPYIFPYLDPNKTAPLQQHTPTPEDVIASLFVAALRQQKGIPWVRRRPSGAPFATRELQHARKTPGPHTPPEPMPRAISPVHPLAEDTYFTIYPWASLDCASDFQSDGSPLASSTTTTGRSDDESDMDEPIDLSVFAYTVIDNPPTEELVPLETTRRAAEIIYGLLGLVAIEDSAGWRDRPENPLSILTSHSASISLCPYDVDDNVHGHQRDTILGHTTSQWVPELQSETLQEVYSPDIASALGLSQDLRVEVSNAIGPNIMRDVDFTQTRELRDVTRLNLELGTSEPIRQQLVSACPDHSPKFTCTLCMRLFATPDQLT